MATEPYPTTKTGSDLKTVINESFTSSNQLISSYARPSPNRNELDLCLEILIVTLLLFNQAIYFSSEDTHWSDCNIFDLAFF